ncbi:MAG: sulfatase [Planctomycetota bacterium]
MKHTAVIFLLLISAACSFGARASDQDKPMNILVLYADDWRYDTLGAAGNEIVQTPRLDALAEKGVMFTQNCVTTSICGVSRANLYTGQWMSRNGTTGFELWDTPWEETYLGLLRGNGYWLGHVGKWHNRLPRDAGFTLKDKFDFVTSYSGRHWYKDPRNPDQKIHVTKRNERDALQFLDERPKDKPFALTVCFFATHAEDPHEDQFLPQPESMELYKDVEIPVPVNATQESWENLPDFFTDANEGRVRWYWRFDTPEKFQRMMKNYYRMATEVDTTSGVILDKLKEQGVLDNTLVIFTTDNGYFHAEHGLADKWYPHQESIRVPLIIKDPRMADKVRGTTNDAFTLSVDLAPTILNAAGIKAPERMQGRSITDLYLPHNPVQTWHYWRSEFFYEHPTITRKERIPYSEALVRKDFKYMYWPEFDYEQLFDLVNDPIEEVDLAKNPEFADKLEEMRKRFKELKEAAK